MAIRLETERLVIRNYRLEDWPAVQEMAILAQDSEYAIYDHEWPTSEREIRAIVTGFSEGDRVLAVCLAESDAPIGLVCLYPDEDGRPSCELGYRLHAGYHGRGYATEGCQAMLEYAFNALEAEEVTAGTAAANGPSRRLLRRLGFRPVGEGRASFQTTPDGEPIEFDSLAYAITRQEWLADREDA